MRKYAGKIMGWTLAGLVLVIVYINCFQWYSRAYAVPTVTSSIIDDWTAVAEGATGESTTVDISGNHATKFHLQAFTDMNDAHEGTRIVVQVSGFATGDEDWSDLHEWIILVGDGDSEPIDDDPLDATDTTIVISDTGGNFESVSSGFWIAIEDSTLINSELCWVTGFTSDTNITVQDGVTNAHAVSTLLWDTAYSKTFTIPIGAGYRARVLIDNSYDADLTASSLNYKLGATVATDMDE